MLLERGKVIPVSFRLVEFAARTCSLCLQRIRPHWVKSIFNAISIIPNKLFSEQYPRSTEFANSAVVNISIFNAFFGLKITRAHTEPFLFYIGLGTVYFLTAQVFLNLGVITGLLPTKGIALPFLSYGGSNLVTNACFIGLLTNLSRDCYSPLRQLRCKVL